MSKKHIETIIKWLIFATFFVPLVVAPSSFIFPFIVPKILLFRSLTTLIIALYAILLYINPAQYRPRASWLNWAVLGFLVSFTLSTFFGSDPYHSFWDNHERMLGLFTIIHYIAYFFICAQVFRTWEDWKLALQIFLVAGSCVMFVGLLQVFNPNFLLNGGSGRVIATVGNAIYVGGYGLFLFAVASLLFLKEKNIWLKVIYVLLAILALIGIIFSGTRGSLLGLIFGIGLAMISYAFTLKGKSKVKNYLLGAIILGVAVLGLAYVNRQSKFVTDIPALSRVLNTSVKELQEGARVIAWGAAFQGWKDRPILGWGPNNFFYAFNAHYDARSLEYGYGETWFDNAHNILVNTLAVQGVVGIITYLAIFAAAIYMLVSAYRGGRVDRHIAVIGAAYLMAHLLENVTVFENPTSYLYFVFWLAMINSLSKVVFVISAEKNKVVLDQKAGNGILLGAGLTAALFIFVLNIQPARANMKTLDALQMINGDVTQSVPLIESALDFNSPHIDDIRSDISRTLVGSLGDTSSKLDVSLKKQLYNIVESSMLANIELHPYDIRNHLTLAQLYQTFAIQNNDASEMIKAEKYLTDTMALSPRRQQVIYNLAIVKLQLGKVAEAETLFKQTITDDPKIAEGYFRLAYMFAAIGQPEKALAVIKQASDNNVTLGEDQLNAINQVIIQAAKAAGASTKTKK
ncbi:MAG: O-antigen ligase family protein [Patescibacteria group bacterium]|jgi:O-antigen ligase